ncbi:hypothetical protein X798_04115 [Onchocerca flexuosa]|uniref:Uncharacterized protein n=1 Tax=Onchocerca flexuosa TaxID=387005 RepID=A0A238BUB0_9BILA|nr:hypothetical protein X798_04115 [Onchocerca flexuosa]
MPKMNASCSDMFSETTAISQKTAKIKRWVKNRLQELCKNGIKTVVHVKLCDRIYVIEVSNKSNQSTTNNFKNEWSLGIYQKTQ